MTLQEFNELQLGDIVETENGSRINVSGIDETDQQVMVSNGAWFLFEQLVFIGPGDMKGN